MKSSIEIEEAIAAFEQAITAKEAALEEDADPQDRQALVKMSQHRKQINEMKTKIKTLRWVLE